MENQEKLAVLKDIGLSDQESAVYVGLLKMGGADATSLAKETGLKRTTAYPILERLISQGVVMAYDQGGKKFFSPLQPNKLMALYENKLKNLSQTIPLLEKLQGTLVEGYGVRFIKSKKELETIYADIIEEYRGRSYYVIGDASAFINIDREFFLEFRKRRASQNIRTKLLLSHESRTEEGQNDPELLREYKYLPAKYKFKSTIDIYDDKIIIVGPEVKALAVVVAIPPMVDVFRSVFEVLWEALVN